MALRQLRTTPDDILKKKSKPVTVIDDKIRALVSDMLETMYDSGGVGLAAVQIGILKQILVIDVSEDDNDPIVIINPEVLSQEGEQESQEACLSVPGYYGLLKRPAVMKIRALNEHGEEFVLDCDDFLAVAVSHELDHLNGILYTDDAIELYEETEEDTKNKKNKKKKLRRRR
ncbi:MAG: peptide deformylase [Defluviitaleaceae bacterium]|nr:peptide deformylase [Defluviitaleaceae bacterium]